MQVYYYRASLIYKWGRSNSVPPTDLQATVSVWSYRDLDFDTSSAYPPAEVIICSFDAIFDCLGKVTGELWMSDDVG